MCVLGQRDNRDHTHYLCVLETVYTLAADACGGVATHPVSARSSETQAEPSLQATQMKLKRARLADNLNEKIAQRPGPMELVEKNILPVNSAREDVPSGRPSETPAGC